MPVSETSGRRSILRNIDNISLSHSNDDDAERLHRRRTHNKSIAGVTVNDSLMEEQEELKNCLKIYHDNKICKENAWTLTLIDNMAKLTSRHHKSLQNFQIIGTTLDATSKIYGLRVDSVHSDVLRLSSGLGRLKPPDKPQNNDNDMQDNDSSVIQNDDESGGQSKPVPKKKRTRKQLSTVTKNKETLNARLETIPLPDPLFSKLNTIMGDVCSSNRLLLNNLQTKTSNLSLTLNEPFWDSTVNEPNVYSENNEYDWNDSKIFSLNSKLDTNHNLRQQISGYLITNTPIDDDDEEMPPAQNITFNQSQIDYAFDINADIEPTPITVNYAIDYDNMDCDGGNDFNDLTNEDRDAIHACKGLRRVPTIIEDLRPADTSKLEYSYRPLDNNINQFWAGPSYWKFRKPRKLTMSKESTVSTVSTNVIALAPKRRVNQKKYETPPFTIVGASEEENDFIMIQSKLALKFKKSDLYKRWDSKKLKLPTDLQLDRNLFSFYQFCPGVPIENNDPSSTPQIQARGYNYDNADDREYCSNVQADDMDRDTDQEIDRDSIVPDEIMPETELIPETQNDQTLNEIGHNFEGAPEMIQKIDIQFAKRAKVIDMKQMKICCLNSLNRQCEKTANRTFTHPKTARPEEKYQDGAASFGVIYNTLPHLLTKSMAENLSPSVAFYSILHLANENRLRLQKTDKTDDPNVFLIRRLE